MTDKVTPQPLCAEFIIRDVDANHQSHIIAVSRLQAVAYSLTNKYLN